MIGKIENDPTLIHLCVDVFKRLENKTSRKECIKEVLDLKFEGKMSELDYIHYQFLKVLNEMYKEGFYAGRNLDDINTDNEQSLSITQLYPTSGRSIRKSTSYNYAIQLAPVIQDIRKNGARTLQEISDKLSQMQIKTMSGQDRWYPASVKRLEKTIAKCTIEFKMI